MEFWGPNMGVGNAGCNSIPRYRRSKLVPFAEARIQNGTTSKLFCGIVSNLSETFHYKLVKEIDLLPSIRILYYLDNDVIRQ